MDPRYESLADNLVSHSTNLQREEKALVHAFGVPEQITSCSDSGDQEQGSDSLRHSGKQPDRQRVRFGGLGRSVRDGPFLGNGKNEIDGRLYCPAWIPQRL